MRLDKLQEIQLDDTGVPFTINGKPATLCYILDFSAIGEPDTFALESKDRLAMGRLHRRLLKKPESIGIKGADMDLLMRIACRVLRSPLFLHLWEIVEGAEENLDEEPETESLTPPQK